MTHPLWAFLRKRFVSFRQFLELARTRYCLSFSTGPVVSACCLFMVVARVIRIGSKTEYPATESAKRFGLTTGRSYPLQEDPPLVNDFDYLK